MAKSKKNDNFEVFSVHPLDPKSKDTQKTCTGVALEIGRKCSNKCEYQVLAEFDEKVDYLFCKDCMLKYFTNLLRDGYWKLDSAQIECHF